MANYIGVIHKDEHSEYGVSFPDFPGCVAAGRNLDEARANAREALQLHIEGMMEEGTAIPEPKSLDAIRLLPEHEDDDVFIDIAVATMQHRKKRYNVSFDERFMKCIDEYANDCGMTRSAFLAKAARELIGKEAC